MDVETLIGYHGTRLENLDDILQDGFKTNTDKRNELFLGAGIYFFFGLEDAIDWNIKKLKNSPKSKLRYEDFQKEYTIIEGKILVKENDILDLDSKMNLYKLEILANKIKQKLVTSAEFSTAKNKTAAIINMLYKRKLLQKKVLVKTFNEVIEVRELNSFKNYARKMFCVKDSKIIDTVKENRETTEEIFNSLIYFYR